MNRFSILVQWLIACCLAASAPLWGGGPDPVLPMLERMAATLQRSNYQGTFVYLHNNQLEAMRIHHVLQDGKVEERVWSLNGSPRQVVGDSQKVTCIAPESDAKWRQSRSEWQFPIWMPANSESLRPYYDFRWLEDDRVAGREVRVIGITPRDSYRYGYKLYLDRDTAFPLKSDLVDERGNPIEQIMFTDLDLQPWTETSAQAETLQQPIPSPEPNTPPQTQLPETWAFASLPSGFALSARETRADPLTNRRFEQYVFSDGLATLSVFIERLAPGEGLSGGSGLGALNAWGGQIDGYQVTAVGEVPLATVSKVMQSATRAVSRGTLTP